MKSNNRYTGIDTDIIESIRLRTQSLHRKKLIQAHEVEDFEQEIIVYVLFEMQRYRASICSRKQYIEQAVKARISQLMRYRFREKRSPKLEIASLDARDHDGFTMLDCDAFLEEHDLVTDDALLECLFLRIDAKSLLESELRDVFELMDRHRSHEICEKLGISRSALQRRIKRIRGIFKKNEKKWAQGRQEIGRTVQEDSEGN